MKWVELLSEEFWLQGDKEKSMGLTVSFLCDRKDTNVPLSQVNFIRGFILPTFEVLVSIFPNLNYTVENANNNINEWQKLVDAHRLKGWTPRNINKENKEVNKSDKKNKNMAKNSYINNESGNKKNINQRNNNIENNKLNKERENILRPNINKWKPEKINIK